MYTGIIQHCLTIKHIDLQPGLLNFAMEFPPQLLEGLQLGASVAIDGTCFTVASIEGNTVGFQAMQETLSLTTTSDLTVGQSVNVERSAKMGDEIGGHPISGHVDGTAEIIAIDTPANNHVITFQVAPQWMKYIFSKGFIALAGASLTVVNADQDKHTFQVWLIPETLERTTFATKQIGDKINFEIDRQTQAIVNTVENMLKNGELTKTLEATSRV